MIKAVLFDMDGILYDSECWYLEGTIDQLRAYGYAGPREAVYKTIGLDMDSNYDLLEKLLDYKVPRDVIIRGNEEYFNVLHPLDYKAIMFPGLPEELRKIRGMGIRTAVCSASPMEIIRNSLDAMGIRDLFDFIETVENVSRPKPFGDIYEKAAEEIGVVKADCIVYEDSTLGIEAGKRAGMFTVAREDNRFMQDQSHADLIVKDIQELTEWIRRENTHA
ncbi:MAG: HAD family phosphatase [Solobacterium sp.]|nr:HAD family phosphatase [Solobacterium sp.]MBQ9824815.1 HAD family phosphatase [Solobacterium sp.]